MESSHVGPGKGTDSELLSLVLLLRVDSQCKRSWFIRCWWVEVVIIDFKIFLALVSVRDGYLCGRFFFVGGGPFVNFLCCVQEKVSAKVSGAGAGAGA